MIIRRTLIAFALLLAIGVAGCAAAPEPTPEPEPAPVEESPAAGLRLAPGLYDLEGGVVQGLGTLEWVELEGGFWAVKGGTEAEGNVGEIVAVIANGADFEDQLKALEGKTVMIDGKRLEGASIRMAGPEVEITSVVEVSDTPGIAE